jgi:hypothetical protein
MRNHHLPHRVKIEHETASGTAARFCPVDSQLDDRRKRDFTSGVFPAPPSECGLPLWLNLPLAEEEEGACKLSTAAEIDPNRAEGAARRFRGRGRIRRARGEQPRHIQATILEQSLSPRGATDLPTKPRRYGNLFLHSGGARVCNSVIAEKTAVLFGPGDSVVSEARAGVGAGDGVFPQSPWREPIAWAAHRHEHGTRSSSCLAFDELRRVFLSRDTWDIITTNPMKTEMRKLKKQRYWRIAGSLCEKTLKQAVALAAKNRSVRRLILRASVWSAVPLINQISSTPLGGGQKGARRG